jgi:hypothetical protein
MRIVKARFYIMYYNGDITAQGRNLSTKGICPVSSHCLASRNNSASDPFSNIINSTDYKRGYTMGQLLAMIMQ